LNCPNEPDTIGPNVFRLSSELPRPCTMGLLKSSAPPSVWRQVARAGTDVLDGVLFKLRRVWPAAMPASGLSPVELHEVEQPLLGLRKLLQDLNTLAICGQFQPGNWEPVDWTTLLRSAVSSLEPVQVERLDVRFAPAGFQGQGHAFLLTQAIENVLSFSLTHAQSQVFVELGSEVSPENCCVSFRVSAAALFALTPEFSEFQPFHPLVRQPTASLTDTTGLTLYTVKKIAELHGGCLAARLKEGLLQLELKCPLTVELQ
jgi:hypothetical protein